MANRGDPQEDVVFDHRRATDGEHVGYIAMTSEGQFIPYDLLRQPQGEPGEIEAAEAVLDEIGLRRLAEEWQLREGDGTWVRVRIIEVDRERVVVGRLLEDGSAHLAKTVDLAARIELPVPTDRLRPPA